MDVFGDYYDSKLCYKGPSEPRSRHEEYASRIPRPDPLREAFDIPQENEELITGKL